MTEDIEINSIIINKSDISADKNKDKEDDNINKILNKLKVSLYNLNFLNI